MKEEKKMSLDIRELQAFVTFSITQRQARSVQIRNRDLTSYETLCVNFHGTTFCQPKRRSASRMVYNLSLGYDELKSVLREVNRRGRRLHFAVDSWLDKKLLEACVDFARSGFRIVNKLVINRLGLALRGLHVAKRRLRILLDGEIKASEMQVQYRAHGVFKWAPRLEGWLDTKAYKLWLGTVQHSLEDCACPIVDSGAHQPS